MNERDLGAQLDAAVAARQDRFPADPGEGAALFRRAIRRRRRHHVLGALGSIAAAAFLVVGAIVAWNGFRTLGDPAPPAGESEVRNGLIAYTCQTPENLEVEPYSTSICLAGPDGTPLGPVTPAGAIDHSPVWSPDGSHLAFIRGDPNYFPEAEVGTSGASTEVVVIDQGGRGSEHVLPLRRSDYRYPSWSPDGRSLVLQNQLRIVRFDLAESTLSVVVSYTDEPHVQYLSPAWSPRDDVIAVVRIEFVPSRDVSEQTIHLVDPDGRDLGQVTAPHLGASLPSWSQDGQWLVFLGEADVSNDSVYIVRRDGTGLRRLQTEDRTWLRGYRPVWSPEGDSILLSRRSGVYEYDLTTERLSRLIGPDLEGRSGWESNLGGRIGWQPVWVDQPSM